jgi:protein SCO1/2
VRFLPVAPWFHGNLTRFMQVFGNGERIESTATEGVYKHMQQSSVPRWIYIALGGAVALVVAAGAALWALSTGRSSTAELPDLATMPAFALTDQEGKPVRSADVKGKVLLVGFIYTSCEDICPMVTAQMKTLQDELKKAGLLGPVELLSISVDPEVDTPERLAAYARQFQADTSSWRFLTGDPDHVRKVVVEGFLLGVQKVPAGHGGHGSHGTAPADYRVEHSGRIALVDPKGQIRAYYDGTQLEPAKVVADARMLAGR